MNIAYFRKTEKTVAEALAALKGALEKRNIAITGETKFPSGDVLIQFLDAKKASAILKEDRMVVGLVPMAALVTERDGAVSVGISNPQLMMGSPELGAEAATVDAMAKDLRAAVQEAAGVGEPSVKKVTLYSTATCPYCKMEKSYLEKKGVKFDLVMVDADRTAAQEMVRKSGQMGVPQTEIAYDDGDSEIIMGFDKDRLEEVLAGSVSR